MEPSNSTTQIFILAGEGNMAGRGGVGIHNNLWDGVVPLACAPDPTKNYRLNADLKWEVAKVPLHRDIDNKNTCGVGPGMAFANAIKYLVAGEIGLVPCAAGGTAINDWKRGTPSYDNMVKRAKAATATPIPTPTPTPTPTLTPTPGNYTASPTATSTCTSTLTGTASAIFATSTSATSTTTTTAPANPTPTSNLTPAVTVTATAGGGEIKALLWYQGESDAVYQNANSYKGKMEELIANIRADLNLPRLPIIQVAIASGDDVKFIEKIRKVQLEMKVDNVLCVDAKGLPLEDDKLYLTTDAQVQLGHKLAKAYIKDFS